MKYENWRELAAECRESGNSIRAWCKENSIPDTTCRQWLERLKKEDENQGTEKASDQKSNWPVWGKIDLSELDQKHSQESDLKDMVNICLKYHDWSIELSPGFDPSLLKQVMKAMESVC